MILVTGATGFVGQAVIDGLISAAYDVRACSRQVDTVFHPSVSLFHTGDLSENSDWQQALQDG